MYAGTMSISGPPIPASTVAAAAVTAVNNMYMGGGVHTTAHTYTQEYPPQQQQQQLQSFMRYTNIHTHTRLCFQPMCIPNLMSLYFPTRMITTQRK